jgi:SNF family Na+-dependent transporter
MDQQGWTAILGLLAPLVIAVLKQSGFTKAQNSLIALGVCLVVGIADAIYFGTLDPMDVAKTVFTVISTAFVTYKMFFQALGIDDWLTAKTSVKK